MNSITFVEYVTTRGFIQKTIKGGLFDKGNYEIPPRNQRGKTPEGESPKWSPCL